ncbi:hypothetical protein UlMin_040664, partial [Ulmus minor]
MGKTIQLYGFASLVSEKAVKEFLESYTGEGTVCDVEVEQHKLGTRGKAKVQFRDDESAETILALAKDAQRLWYDEDSYLKARECYPDNSMDEITLHFGGQISKEKFSSLWKMENVTVTFGVGLRKLHFFFSCGFVEYKLELSYDNIWQIELHRPHGQRTQFLIIQLLGAPRIFKKEVPDNYWVRDVDFTAPSCCIGQSSAICLELPYHLRLPNSRDGFVYYKEVEGQLALEKGSAYACYSDLVPIVSPPEGVELPYKILFKINSLVQHGCIPGEALDVNFFKLVDPQRIKLEYIECALEKLNHLKDCCYDPLRWLKKQYIAYSTSRQTIEMPTIALDEGLVYVHRVQITPSKVYFRGPEINLSNRVLRHWPEDIDNFLRVSFVDEDLDQIHSKELSPRGSSKGGEKRTRIYERILSILRNGIAIGDKKFEFLGFSSSQLKDNSVWMMFASRPGLSAEDIREWMGDFRQIRNVAKYAARLGQSFSSSRETMWVGKHELELIPDVEVHRGGNKYCFSDGIGKISAEFAEIVARKCGLNRFPSAFQIRYGGFKGVVAVDPTSSKKLSLRGSMSNRYQPYFLNRQLITLLSTLGVKDSAFEKKQREAVKRLDAILIDPLRAHDELELTFPGEITHILKEMLICGYKPDEEPFLSMMLQTFRALKLQELRTKTRIHVPNGGHMMGCLDETGLLEYGEVFVQSSHRKLFDDSSLILRNFSSDQEKFVVKGKVVVARNPCLHPGDVRVLKAVDVPELHHMVDCVVFPQKGMRPHPDECSGGDLDGDGYFVCWDPDLIPPQKFPPMDYSPAPIIELDHDVTME